MPKLPIASDASIERDKPDPKPPSTHSPVNTVLDDEKPRRVQRPAETSKAERGGDGLTLGEDEIDAAGGNRDR